MGKLNYWLLSVCLGHILLLLLRHLLLRHLLLRNLLLWWLLLRWLLLLLLLAKRKPLHLLRSELHNSDMWLAWQRITTLILIIWRNKVLVSRRIHHVIQHPESVAKYVVQVRLLSGLPWLVWLLGSIWVLKCISKLREQVLHDILQIKASEFVVHLRLLRLLWLLL